MVTLLLLQIYNNKRYKQNCFFYSFYLDSLCWRCFVNNISITVFSVSMKCFTFTHCSTDIIYYKVIFKYCSAWCGLDNMLLITCIGASSSVWHRAYGLQQRILGLVGVQVPLSVWITTVLNQTCRKHTAMCLMCSDSSCLWDTTGMLTMVHMRTVTLCRPIAAGYQGYMVCRLLRIMSTQCLLARRNI